VAFYERLEAAIRKGDPPPVPLEAGIATLRVIEAARASAEQGVVVPL
jgi:predicted dehydrogenase